MGKNIYVGNLPYDTTGDDLVELFQTYGTVTSGQVIIDKFSGRSRGFGFVEMSQDDEAQAAIEALNGTPYGGRPLTVNEARPSRKRRRRWRRGRGWLWRRRRLVAAAVVGRWRRWLRRGYGGGGGRKLVRLAAATDRDRPAVSIPIGRLARRLQSEKSEIRPGQTAWRRCGRLRL